MLVLIIRSLLNKSMNRNIRHLILFNFMISVSGKSMRGDLGATVRNRTADILITSEVLYQLSYGGFKNYRLFYPYHNDRPGNATG